MRFSPRILHPPPPRFLPHPLAMLHTAAVPVSSIADLPISHTFTDSLPPDPDVPTPDASAELQAARSPLLLPRVVSGGLYTYVRPDGHAAEGGTQILAISDSAVRDLGLAPDAVHAKEFADVVTGQTLLDGHYPWATLYGGYQFMQWAGQLGDGRAISLFEATNPATGVRYEVQLKGSGRTPFSRFADGRAVLRSCIREFLVSEGLNALSIPTTRALALVSFPEERVLRDGIEPRAAVVRMAQSWLRIGSFDIQHRRANWKLLKQLADYAIDNVFGGYDALVANDPNALGGLQKYHALYKEIVRRTAKMTALTQGYGFMNGVLNTDNISIFGLNLDFGPFAFMDTFDPFYTPNHDDHQLIYSYRRTPTAMWFNLVKLGEDLSTLFGAADTAFLESPEYLASGVLEDDMDGFVKRCEKIIEDMGVYFRKVYMHEHDAVFSRRLGLTTVVDGDSEKGIISETLELLQTLQLDFNHFFRRLSEIRLFDADESNISSVDDVEAIFFTHERGRDAPPDADAARTLHTFLIEKYKHRLESEKNTDDAARAARMNAVNPNFILRNWILDDVIRRVQRENDQDVLQRVLYMAQHPFNDVWTTREEDEDKYNEERRFIGDVPRRLQGTTCSCSS
ncbi:uncharacterized protein V1518DRAFT_419737 [Limtongia smithiae]|uniref:uncharacterized protein n=1 Tax=Limtongia smithiae TaxID=1125753 RepID=UPI0034CF7F99